jgi:hypothetical protein
MQIGTPQASQPADLLTLGLSWVLTDVDGVPVWTHDGSTFGQNSRLYIVPELDFAYCALTNVNDGGAVLGAGLVWATENLLGRSLPVAPPPSPLPLDAAALAAYTAVYENPGENRYTLRMGDDGLEMTPQIIDPVIQHLQPPFPETPPIQMAFSAPDELYAVDEPSLRGAFLRNPAGDVAGLFLGGRFNVRL